MDGDRFVAITIAVNILHGENDVEFQYILRSN